MLKIEFETTNTIFLFLCYNFLIFVAVTVKFFYKLISISIINYKSFSYTCYFLKLEMIQ